MRHARRALAALATVALITACSSGDDDTGDGDESATSATSDETQGDGSDDASTESTRPADGSDGSSRPDDAPAATTAPPTTAAPEPLFGTWEELIEIASAPGESEGRPVLSWSSIDGADLYAVYVYAPDGRIYWSWQGPATSVALGGDIGEAPGPVAADGMTWAVVAWDADLLPVSVSLVEPLTP